MTTPLSPAAQDAAFRPAEIEPMRWDELLAGLDRAGQPADVVGSTADRPGPTGVTMDSRMVRPGDLYAGVPGASRHGAEFAGTVVAAGARGILTDRQGARLCAAASSAGIPVLIVEDVRDAVGPAAAAVYGNIGAGPRLYGITGTNGKTTTNYFLTALLGALGETTGMIGTIEIRAGQRVVPSTLTTPESTQLHALMALMRQEDVSSAVMEVSSHSVSYRRIAGLHYAVAGFTNLTQDHLDLHGSMDDYFRAKAGLFDAGRTDRAVITLDGGPDAPDADGQTWGTRMTAEAGCPVVTLALGPAADHGGRPLSGDWTVTDLVAEGMGHRFTLRHAASGREVTGSTGLPGRFNVANAALAAVMVLESRPPADWDRIAAVLDAPVGEGPFATAVPGRMEVVGRAPDAIVDFAHNPDGMVRALESVREARRATGNDTGRTILVFGATGDRDRAKRPGMGRIAAEWADVVIVTDDDPHTEPPAGIRTEVLQGVHEGVRTAASAGRTVQVHESAPRQDAIELAVSLATPADTVLLAGRGHETVQDMDGVDIPLDDRVELRDALARHGHGPSPVSSEAARKVDGS
jgi:UDP-N-acetylmuramoyl-L-alanyl-D-glutamate--2,6-diaminopimelate ligase